MKEIKEFMHLDVWKLTEPVKYDSDVATISLWYRRKIQRK